MHWPSVCVWGGGGPGPIDRRPAMARLRHMRAGGGTGAFLRIGEAARWGPDNSAGGCGSNGFEPDSNFK
jgi:hypothetical protein